jgi:hypothetical protein
VYFGLTKQTGITHYFMMEDASTERTRGCPLAACVHSPFGAARHTRPVVQQRQRLTQVTLLLLVLQVTLCLACSCLVVLVQENEVVVNARNNSSSKGGQALQPAPEKQQHQPAQQPEQQSAKLELQQQQQQPEQRQVPRLIMRTCFFDDAALAAVGAAPQRAVRCLQPLLQHVAEQGLPFCKQVCGQTVEATSRACVLAVA